MKTILVGYDGTRAAERALTRTAELARAFDANVVVASVATPEALAMPGAFGLGPYYEFRSAETLSVEADEAVWERHRVRVEQFFADAGVAVEFAGLVGQPVEEIVELADQQHADLIVVGTREPGFIERLLGGSVSQGIARRAHGDVLIVHPGADEAESA